MTMLERIDRHDRLLSEMTKTMNIDLSGAIENGEMSVQEMRGRLMRCLTCGQTDQCEKWLAEHRDGADAPPEFCRNRLTLIEEAAR